MLEARSQPAAAGLGMSAAGGRHQLSLVSAAPNFNAVATIKPKETFTYEYKLPVDSPRRFDWSFRVDDLQAGGSRRGAEAVEFWCDAHWTLEEDDARTDVIKPRRPFPEARLHSDFHCVREVDGRAEVHFRWENVTPTPLRLSFTVRGTRLRSPPTAGEVPMETRGGRELDTALATLPDIIAQKAPGFAEEDMCRILFTDFRGARRAGNVKPERWSLLETLAAWVHSQSHHNLISTGVSDRLRVVAGARCLSKAQHQVAQSADFSSVVENAKRKCSSPSKNNSGACLQKRGKSLFQKSAEQKQHFSQKIVSAPRLSESPADKRGKLRSDDADFGQSFSSVLDLAKLHQGTQGWRYFLHKELEVSRAAEDAFEFASRPRLADKRPEAVSTMRASMAGSVSGSHQSITSLGNAACAMLRLTTAAGMVSITRVLGSVHLTYCLFLGTVEAYPPECVCSKMKPKLSAMWPERRIIIDGTALKVFEIDAGKLIYK